uniref:MH2 domain-containing protein n=1 Tax=Setaria digitata TaxID=48799 RepID=A0A915PTN1_9BILA
MRDERSLSRTEAACMAGAGRGWNGIDELRALSANDTERWYTVEQFERDHVVEILEKLEEGSLDDEIWGKIILMEKCRRLAKAYLRRTTVIIDGSSDEYDGITLGFNHFENYDNDDIRHKIGDGVIVKVDENGNIKAMARGLAPVIVQGWNEPTSKCISEQLITQKGRLKTIKDRLKGITDQQRIEKIFDMRLFNLAIERELNEPEPNTPELLLKTCIRVSLVKDAATNALKTPCWFMIINLVALDVLRTKLPVLRPVSGTFRPSSRNDIIFSTPATTQSTATLNEIFPSCTKQSLSCSDSEEIPTPMQKAIHNKKKRSPSKNLSLSSKSSSGFSSMDFVKNFEKVENWRKNSSGFLEQKKDEILADEETDDTTSSEHELIKPTEQWSVGKSPPFTQRKLLLSNDQSVNKNSDNNKATNFSNSYICQGGHCIRISDYDEHVQDELKQKSGRLFEFVENFDDIDCMKILEFRDIEIQEDVLNIKRKVSTPKMVDFSVLCLKFENS